MESFIKSVLLDLKKKEIDLDNLVFILPSKRAGTFLKHHISEITDYTMFLPQILSIEEFVENLSGLKTIPNPELLFKLFKTYKALTPSDRQESFDQFSKWAQILLQDFNEIDRYLIDQGKIFDYLNAIKTLDHWSLEDNHTDLIKNHLNFWNQLKPYYIKYTDDLLNNKKGYQGLIYREATENLEPYIETSTKTHVFLGFNALNTSESLIIQGLLENDLALIYWDIDKTFIEDPIHDAGLFTRSHKTKWNYFKKNPFNWVTSNYSENKHIEVIGIPKLVGQAKYIGHLLRELKKQNPQLNSTAVVLGEENLLIPVLNSIPEDIERLNVTMGLPLKLIPLASLFQQLFSIHKTKSDVIYHVDIVNILSHPALYVLFDLDDGNEATHIINHIQNNNLIYLSSKELEGLTNQNKNVINLLFQSWDNKPTKAIASCLEIILLVKEQLNADKTKHQLELEYLYRFYKLFNNLSDLNSTYSYLDSINALNSVFNELLSSETLDFKGEPLEGLQIMGMLESRVLDFETVIISSVNEGILPSGKTNNSFIPFDVKIENKLPTFKEKDAVYTYHFYRLLQRAKNVYILYNTEVDALKGGEKSRFITQLEIEGIHNIKHTIVAPEIPNYDASLEHISKTPLVIEQLKKVATKGFSPSSLTNYIRNPIDFYFEKVLDVKQFEDVEEHIAANTLGSVIHNTLEDFYKPFEGHYIKIKDLKNFKTKVKSTVTKHFKDLYKEGDFTKGKNLIIFEIAQRYIVNFINTEIESLRAGKELKIIAIEADENIEIDIEGLDFPVKLKGKVDRIDEYDKTIRVIDYKSGKVEQSKVEIVNWEDLTTDYDKYSKSFQILCYAYMMHKLKKIELPIEAGIISFKNLNNGFLKFGKKDSPKSRKKNHNITEETLDNFEIELKKLILEICNPNIDFIEKELK